METPHTADQLKAWRAGHKWTQQEAAGRLGLSLRGYQDKEAGKRHVSRQDTKLIGYVDKDEAKKAKKKATA
jgi:transcriptional regulator with XRE-family HTH domain